MTRKITKHLFSDMGTYNFHNIYSIIQLLLNEKGVHVVKKYSKMSGSVPIWNEEGYFMAGSALLRTMTTVDHCLVSAFDDRPIQWIFVHRNIPNCGIKPIHKCRLNLRPYVRF